MKTITQAVNEFKGEHPLCMYCGYKLSLAVARANPIINGQADNDFIDDAVKLIMKSVKGESLTENKPPLGIKPEKPHLKERYGELIAAIARYQEAGKQTPIEWLEEMIVISKRLLDIKLRKSSVGGLISPSFRYKAGEKNG